MMIQQIHPLRLLLIIIMMFSFVYSVETPVLPGQIDASHDRPMGAVDRTGADISSASLLPTSEFWLCVTSLSVKLPEH